MKSDLRNTVILVTGGGGSLGTALTERLLLTTSVKTIRLLDASETALYKSKQKFGPHTKLRWLQGDIRDHDRVAMAMSGVDHVIHCAALKSVDIASQNPLETCAVNIPSVLIQEAFRSKPRNFLALSSDKALLGEDSSVYHATKNILEGIIRWADEHSDFTRFACIRPANFVPSDMSVLETWYLAKKRHQPIPLTDPNATRYFIPIERAADYVIAALRNMKGGETFIPPGVKFSMLQLAERAGPRIKITGLRPGDRLEERLLTIEEEKRARKVAGMLVV